MNFLQILKAKETKLETTASVKLTAFSGKDGEIILCKTGVIVPSDEIQSFENGIVIVSGNFAKQTSKQEALATIKL
jgi:hypothetical protein